MNSLDATGTAFELGRPPRRIVSLVPSLTETLFALGAGSSVVGVTRYCTEPSALVGPLPKIGGTKSPDLEAVIGLAPDLVVASKEENRADDVDALRQRRIPVFVTHYPSVALAIAGVAALGRIVGAADSPDWLREASALVAERLSAVAAPVWYFCPIWRRPYMVARRDTYMADLLALAGGENAFPAAGPARYYPVDLAAIAAAAPDVILLPDEPYPFAQKHVAEFSCFADVPAVVSNRIHLIDGKALTWYGPRIAPALKMLVGLLGGVALGAATGRAIGSRP